jgi:proteasome lid subunit RPN8/RPN11
MKIPMSSVSAYSDPPALPGREPPLREGTYHRHGPEGSGEGVRILIAPPALAAIHAHSQSQMESELGGVLLGFAYQHRGQRYVEVQVALPAPSEDRGPYHFTFNADVWAHVNRERDARYPALQIVGWFHTHPGLGVFFSADDVVVHSAAFVMPWHIALVVDPIREEAAFFGWEGHEVTPLPGFYELGRNSDDGAPAFPWRLVRAPVWKETYEEHLARRSRVSTASPAWPTPGPWLALSAASAVLLSAVLLLVLGVLPLYRQNQALQAAALPLLEERMAWAAGHNSASCPDPAVRLYAPAAGATVDVGSAERVAIAGVTALADARRYSLALRPMGGESWQELDTVRRATSLRTLTTWETADYAAGDYELLLQPLNRQGGPLPGAAECTIHFTLAR